MIMRLTKSPESVQQFTTISSLLILSAIASPAHAQNFARGQELYNQQCQSCHEDLMHARNRKLKTINGLRSRIQDWSSHSGNSWTAEEIDDVLYYLNKSFYHFDQKPL